MGCRNGELAAKPVEPIPAQILEAIARLFPRFTFRHSQEPACA